MFSVEIIGDKELVARFDEWGPRVRAAVNARMVSLVALLEGRIKEKLSGEVLAAPTGRLRASIISGIEDHGDKIIGTVESPPGAVPYAHIHEYGGVTSPHVILPVRARALHFMMGGESVFAMRVNHPGSRIPERSYMRSALEEERETIAYSLYAAALIDSGMFGSIETPALAAE